MPAAPATLLLAALAASPLPVAADGFLNPSGILLGGTAAFEVSVEPSAFPDSAIHWSADPASRVSFPFGSFGRAVLVRGEEPGDVALRVDIDGYAGAHPVANARVVPLSTVKADAWIVGDGAVWARTDDEVRGLFSDANSVFSQVGVRISLESITRTNNLAWFGFDPEANNWLVPYQMASAVDASDRLVCFFVRNMTGYYGLHHERALLVRSDATFAVLAHETGHAFGLRDIYIASSNETPLSVPSGLPPSKNNLPGDWGSIAEEGYYPSGIMHSNIIVRLLMYGEGDGGGGGGLDIPFDDVYGLWYELVANPQTGSREKVWRLSRAPVSFFEHASLPAASP